MWDVMQSRFAAAVLDPESAVPPGVSSAGRFSVYRNNVVSGLIDALAVRFPATRRIVGEDFFAAMAREFIARRPPASPALLEYGGGFADFVARFEPAAELVYLPDVVRLEDARVRAFHAEDAAPSGFDALSALPMERLAERIFEIHPSVSLVRSTYPIVTIWEMNMGEIELAEIADWSGEDALVARPELAVHVHRLPAGGAVFLDRLMKKETLGDAYAAAAQTAHFDLAASLTTLLRAGTFTAIGEKSGDER